MRTNLSYLSDDEYEKLGNQFPEILCKKCSNDTFQIAYGCYECFGKCTKCGNIQSLYMEY